MSHLKSPWTRRAFMRTSSLTALCAAVPARFMDSVGLYAQESSHTVPTIPLESHADPETVRVMAFRAIDAAKEAGATYAEARITRHVGQTFMGPGLFIDSENLGIGVRALVNGAWGFAASPYWNLNEAVQLAKDAVAQATANAKRSSREIDMGTYPIASGSWSTPIRIDPFKISLEEKTDFVVSLLGLFPKHIRRRDISGGMSNMGFARQERAVATTEGAYFTQTLYQAGGSYSVSVRRLKKRREDGTRSVSATGLSYVSGGWEVILDANIRQQIPGLIEQAEALFFVPEKPIDIGRYTVVCDAATVGNLVSGTLGQATQLDRALGYEANASGTSYLGPDPFARLGTSLGDPLLNISGERSMPKGLATVKWDDEGVEPESFTIVKDGVLQDYQTTREQAAWLTSWYKQQGRTVRSHGCAVAASALDAPLQFPPNLVMAPGQQDVSFDDLVADTKRGLAIMGGGADMDFQSRTGTGEGLVREIVNGKLGAIVTGGAYLFDSVQLWKSLQAIGGASSSDTVPAKSVKGQPAQASLYSVSAVPGVFKDMAMIDPRRKA